METGPTTLEQFNNALQTRPFRPFVMHLADGREITVKHPQLVVSTSTGRTAVVVQPDDTLNIIDLLLVTGRLIERPRSTTS